MPTGTMVREQYALSMAPGLKHVFVHFLNLAMRASKWQHIFNEEKSDRFFEDEAEYGDIGALALKDEGTSVGYTTIVEGGSKRYLPLTYALAMRASFELFDDECYDIIKKMPKALARAAMFTVEMQAANIFNLGFTTSVTTTDGVSLFNNQHPLLGGVAATNLGPGVSNVISLAGTYPNRPATDVDLSVSALQLALNQYNRGITSSGLPWEIRPKTLLIPPELTWIAREILGSGNKPYTTDNEINALLGDGLNFMTWQYLTSQSAWFLLPEKSSHQLKYVERMKLKTAAADDFDTQSVKELAIMRFVFGATSWVGTWATNAP
jgi:phage major head subunit gpT-like protein